MPVIDAGDFTIIEVIFALAAVGAALVFPSLGRRPRRLYAALASFSRHYVRCGIAVALLPLAIRFALLPWVPVPAPAVQEEFSNLLEADTFAHGRLANPPHPMSVFFDNVQIIQYPKYVSARLPGTAVFLWAGQKLFGLPWIGVCLAVAAMCAAFYWMLLGWTRPRWALFCAILFALHFGIFTYWMNSYWPGSPPALGGALVLGATVRLFRRAALWPAVLFSIGSVVLVLNRPMEGIVFIAPAAAAIAIAWSRAGGAIAPRDMFFKVMLPVSAVCGACLVWLLYYNVATTGHPTLLAYTIWRNGQAVAPTFWWQPPQLAHLVYYSPETWRFFHHFEKGLYVEISQGWHVRLRTLFWRVMLFLRLELGFLLVLPLLFPVLKRDSISRRRWTVLYFVAVLLGAAGFVLALWFNTLPIFLFLTLYAAALIVSFGLASGIYMAPLLILILGLGLRLLTVFSMPNYYPEFIAPATILIAEGFRRMHAWSRRRRMGAAMARNLFLAACGMAVVHAAVPVLGYHVDGEDPFYMNSYENRLTDRIRVERFLESQPGPQLAIVRYAPGHNELLEWVWNQADIDKQKVVWAREQQPGWTSQLLRYYAARKAWLVEPDAHPVRVTPYPTPVATEPACPLPRADYKDAPANKSCAAQLDARANTSK